MKKKSVREKNLNQEAEISTQFPVIENLLQSENFNTVNKDFTAAYEELEKVSKARGGMKKASEAPKAMKSIERVMDLFRELLKLKYQIAQGEVSAPQGKK